MKKYRVTRPIVGTAYAYIEANSEEEAKETAEDFEIEQWETTDGCQGNVCSQMHNYVEVEEE